MNRELRERDFGLPSDHDLLRVVLSSQLELKAVVLEIRAQVDRIIQAVPVPETYTHAQVCKRLGISSSLGYKNSHLLPKPLIESPRRYRVEDVEAILRANNGEGIRKWERRLPAPVRRRAS